MTTQEDFTFNEYTEEEGGWYERLTLFSRYSKVDPAKPLDVIHAMTEIVDVMASRCDKPDVFKKYLNSLTRLKAQQEIIRIITAIGFLNPAPKND